jgi:hypothetical protein
LGDDRRQLVDRPLHVQRDADEALGAEREREGDPVRGILRQEHAPVPLGEAEVAQEGPGGRDPIGEDTRRYRSDRAAQDFLQHGAVAIRREPIQRSAERCHDGTATSTRSRSRGLSGGR